ncbi:MAG: hypothetical protein ABWW65_05910 [Thermoprotei archaeon]
MKKALVFPALIILLTLTGSVLAMWYDVLKARVTIDTGEVDIEYGKQVRVWEEEHGKPWVANCTAEFVEVENEDLNNPFGNNDLDLNITIVNGYPSYMCKVQDLQIFNRGTIPVKLNVSSVKAKVLGGDWRVCVKTTDRSGRTIYECDADGDGKYDINLWGCFTTTEGYQLEPGEWTSFTVETHIKQDATEGTTYIIQILIRGIQWNEYPPEE